MSLKDTIKWLFHDSTDSDRDIVQLILDAVNDRAVKVIPDIHEYAFKEAYKSAKAMVNKRKAKEKKAKTVVSPVTKRKYKVKAKRNYKKVWDAATVLEKIGANSGGNAHGPPKNLPLKRGIKAKVTETLLQTTGKIGAHELAEYLDLSPKKVSTTLSAMFKASTKGLFREAAKHTTVNNQEVAQYVYWLDEGIK